MARVFLYVPIIPYRFGFCQSCPASLTAGLWTVPFRRFCRPIKRQSTAKCARGARRHALPITFCQRSPTDAKPQTQCLAGVAREVCVALRALRCESSTTAGHPRVGLCMPCKDDMRVFTLKLAFGLCGLLGFVRSVSHNMVTACNNSLASSLLLVLRSAKLLLTPSTPYCVIASIRPQL